MAKKKTQEEFIAQLKWIYGDQYDYTLVRYVNAKTPVTLICPQHGAFQRLPSNLLKQGGCPKCSHEMAGSRRRKTTEEFIREALRVHGDKFDYSLTRYVDASTPVRITCPKHGTFEQRPSDHLRTTGCPTCGIESTGSRLRKSREQFIKEASTKYGSKFDYTQVNYQDSHTPVTIICPIHGEFSQTPTIHLQSRYGCPKCGATAGGRENRLTFSEFQQQAQQKFGDKYVYNESSYRGYAGKLKITCPVHGAFTQSARDHLKSSTGCPKCSAFKRQQEQIRTPQFFVEKAQEVHGKSFDYSMVEYKGSKEKVKIICPTHGEFWQTPDGHLQGKGCVKCATGRISAEEIAVSEFIRSLLPDVPIHTQTYIEYGNLRRFLDISIPSLGLAIEYNGLYWHSSARGVTADAHLLKKNLADYHGYRLIHIFEDDWLHRKSAVEHLLRYALGVLPVIMARKTTPVKIPHSTAKRFYQQYHVQGSSMAAQQVHYGLMYHEELVAVMSFSQHSSGRRKLTGKNWELVRFASRYRVQGGASKLFRQFLRDTQPDSVLSFSWTHLFDGRMYERLGFSLDQELSPDYSYVDPHRVKRLHKSGFQHSKLKIRFGDTYDPGRTEQENCAAHHFYRIYDCGKKRWLWTK